MHKYSILCVNLPPLFSVCCQIGCPLNVAVSASRSSVLSNSGKYAKRVHLKLLSVLFQRFFSKNAAGSGGERCHHRRFQRPIGSLHRSNPKRNITGRRAPESGAAETGPAPENTERIQQQTDIFPV